VTSSPLPHSQASSGSFSVFQDRPAQELAQALFHEAADALLLVRTDTLEVVDVNRMTCKLSGVDRDALVGKAVGELLHREVDSPDWESPVRKTQTFHGHIGYTLRRSNPDAWVPVSVSISRLHFSQGQPLALFIVRDLRDLIEANRRLQRMEEELQRVLLSVADCVWSAFVEAGGDWRYAYLSPVIEQLTGYPADRFLASRSAFDELVHEEDRPAYESYLADLRAGRSARGQFRVRHADGSTRWLSERVNGTGTSKDAGFHLFGILSDVSEARQAEEERRQLEEKMVQIQLMDTIGKLAGGAAHQFNNLLTPILGFTDLAARELPSSSPVRPLLEQVTQAGQRLATLTQQLLAYSGKGRFLCKAVNLTNLIQEMAQLLESVVAKKAILRLELSPSCSEIQADPTQIRQVIVNLLTNAAEALGDTPSTILLRTGRETLAQPATLSPLASPDLPAGPYAFLEVEDAGCGIAAEHLPRIFDPFFSTKFTGRGLGLAAVLGIVRSHQGLIQVASQPNQGTRVRVYFPCSEESSPSGTAQAEQTHEQGKAPAPRQRSVLVADDEEMIRQLAEHILAPSGCQLYLAQDGRQAIALLEQHPEEIEMVFLDLSMPGLSAPAVVEELQRLRPEVPVVIMSGFSADDLRDRFREHPPAGFLEKPFHPTQLLDLLDRLTKG
jgi:two-component system cell cycle sensor histidine kinase/response regulator CckA